MISLLRVISTAWILLVHAQRFMEPSLFANFASWGADGVKCFYFLTGYLVMNSWQTRRSTKDYWRKRIGKVLPLYYFFLLLLTIFRFEWWRKDILSIPRALLLLEYIAPSTVSYDYCGMYLLGTIAIFMTFYLVIPFLAKRIHSLDGAFVAFWCAVLFSLGLNKVYHVLYGSFCPKEELDVMSLYFCGTIPYFAAGVMFYYGKRENDTKKLLAYMLLIAGCSLRYSFFAELSLSDTGCMCLLFSLVLCYPPQVFTGSPIWGGGTDRRRSMWNGCFAFTALVL